MIDENWPAEGRRAQVAATKPADVLHQEEVVGG